MMSQEEAIIAMMVNIPDTIHPTSCAVMETKEAKDTIDNEDSCDKKIY